MQRRAAILAWGGTGFAFLFSGFAIALAIANGPALRNVNLAGAFVQAVVPALAIALVGGLIASRRPQNPIGWILCLAALGSAGSVFGQEYATYSHFVRTLPAGVWLGWAGEWVSAAALARCSSVTCAGSGT